jgi:ubiquinone/menaquinone biosynthesis C-methylase UbiE
MQTDVQKKPHSADYFNDQRDFWWNRDFLELMARRWQLKKVKHTLDVGCGVGHWGRMLIPLLPENASIIGLDREPAWIEQAHKKAESLGLSHRMSYQTGNAEKLPFEDETFDMVTCQTLLIHVQDPRLVLKEMLRVLKPKGLLAVAEPNNTNGSYSNLYYEKLRDNFQITEELQSLKLAILCQRGKYLLGEGFNSIGDLIPGFLTELRMEEIQVYLSDKASALFPPYESKEQQVLVQQEFEWEKQDFIGWNREDTLRYFIAGGGTKEEFEECWASAKKGVQEYLNGIRQKKYHSARGMWMYLVSGWKRV